MKLTSGLTFNEAITLLRLGYVWKIKRYREDNTVIEVTNDTVWHPDYEDKDSSH